MSSRHRYPYGHLGFIRVALILLLAFPVRRVSAEPAKGAATVILLQPTNASEATRQSLARIRDELSADRFHVIWEDSAAREDSGITVEGTGHDTEPNSILVLFGDPATGQVELCVVHRSAGHSAVRRVTVIADDPGRMPEALASRALELLRATALELSLTVDATPPARESLRPHLQVPVAQKPPPSVTTSEGSIASIDLGLGILKSIEGPPPAVTPVGRVGLHLSDSIHARLSLAGLGSRPVATSAYGTATISQTLALLELTVLPRLVNHVRPLFSVGGGVLNVAVAGTGMAPYEGLKQQQWSAVVDAGTGIAVAIRSHTSLVTEVHAFVASPHPVVRFIDTRAATIGNPSLMLTLTLRVDL